MKYEICTSLVFEKAWEVTVAGRPVSFIAFFDIVEGAGMEWVDTYFIRILLRAFFPLLMLLVSEFNKLLNLFSYSNILHL